MVLKLDPKLRSFDRPCPGADDNDDDGDISFIGCVHAFTAV
jgi:hypothetical protein